MRSVLALGLLLAAPSAYGQAIGSRVSCPPSAVAGATNFSWRLFTSIAGANPGTNVVISPASVVEALGMVQAGSGTQTRAALDCAIGVPARRPRIGSRSDSSVTLAVANSLWLRKQLTPNPAWVGTLKKDFAAEVASLDPSSGAAVQRINGWVDKATRHKITGILQSPPDPSTMLLLLNAVYFKGKWRLAFDSSRTRPDSFNLEGGRRVPVRMMWQTDRYRYRHAEGMSIVRLPYRGDRYAFYVILPDTGKSLAGIEGSLEPGHWAAWRKALTLTEITLGVPRFKLSLEQDLAAPLTDLGLGILFDDQRADFRPMLAVAPPGPLSVGKALQKVFIEVNEEGTEAAAVTMIGVQVTSVRAPPPRVVLNRPFLFVLQDDSSGTILFTGRVANPSGK